MYDCMVVLENYPVFEDINYNIMLRTLSEVLEGGTKPVLVYTDDGRDVDDIEAITYLQGCSDAEIIGLVTTHMIPDKRARIARAVMDNLGNYNVPIGVGSVYPIGKEDELLENYLKEHTIDNVSYEGDGLIETFPTSESVIYNAIDAYGSDLSIAVLAPMTDLAKALEKDPDTFSQIGNLYIQGQTLVENGQLVPNPAAYNLKEDLDAAEKVFALQDKINFTLVGKFAAYEIPLMKSDFEQFAATNNPVGTYLKTHAEKGIECFAKRAPDIFERVFGVSADQWDTLEKLSNPYDAVTVMALTQPELFDVEKVGNHTLIGMTKENTGIKNPQLVKEQLMEKILKGLKQPSIYL